LEAGNGAGSRRGPAKQGLPGLECPIGKDIKRGNECRMGDKSSHAREESIKDRISGIGIQRGEKKRKAQAGGNRGMSGGGVRAR